MATMHGSVLKEIHQLMNHLSKLTAGQGSLENVESDGDTGVHRLYVALTPTDGLYMGARVRFEIKVPPGYPSIPPEVVCLDRVYHPNIDLPDEEFGLHASVCINTLDTDWQPCMGLDGCVMSLLFLLYNPNIDDALSPMFGDEMSDEELEANVKISLNGGQVEGVAFDRLMVRVEGIEGDRSLVDDYCLVDVVRTQITESDGRTEEDIENVVNNTIVTKVNNDLLNECNLWHKQSEALTISKPCEVDIIEDKYSDFEDSTHSVVVDDESGVKEKDDNISCDQIINDRNQNTTAIIDNNTGVSSEKYQYTISEEVLNSDETNVTQTNKSLTLSNLLQYPISQSKPKQRKISILRFVTFLRYLFGGESQIM